MSTCDKKGCTARRFMDSAWCFDHQQMGPPTFFKVWFAVCALAGVVFCAAVLWGGYELIQWVTSK